MRELFHHFQGNCIHLHPTVTPQIKPATPSANSRCAFALLGRTRPAFSKHFHALGGQGGNRKILFRAFVHMLLRVVSVIPRKTVAF